MYPPSCSSGAPNQAAHTICEAIRNCYRKPSTATRGATGVSPAALQNGAPRDRAHWMLIGVPENVASARNVTPSCPLSGGTTRSCRSGGLSSDYVWRQEGGFVGGAFLCATPFLLNVAAKQRILRVENEITTRQAVQSSTCGRIDQGRPRQPGFH